MFSSGDGFKNDNSTSSAWLYIRSASKESLNSDSFTNYPHFDLRCDLTVPAPTTAGGSSPPTNGPTYAPTGGVTNGATNSMTSNNANTNNQNPATSAQTNQITDASGRVVATIGSAPTSANSILLTKTVFLLSIVLAIAL